MEPVTVTNTNRAPKGISPLLAANDGPSTIADIREEYADRLAPIRKPTREEMAYALIQLSKDSLNVGGSDPVMAGNAAFEANALLHAAEAIWSPPEQEDPTVAPKSQKIWECYARAIDLVRPATLEEKIDFLLEQAEPYLDDRSSDCSAQDRFEGRLLLEVAQMLENSVGTR